MASSTAFKNRLGFRRDTRYISTRNRLRFQIMLGCLVTLLVIFVPLLIFLIGGPGNPPLETKKVRETFSPSPEGTLIETDFHPTAGG